MSLTAIHWHGALAEDRSVTMVTEQTARALRSGTVRPDAESVPHYRPGGVVLLTAVVLLDDGVPRWIERTRIDAIAVDGATPPSVDLGRAEAGALARALLARAGADPGSAGELARLLFGDTRTSLYALAEERGTTVGRELSRLARDVAARPASFLLFDLRRGVWQPPSS